MLWGHIVKSINEIQRVTKEQADQFMKERLVTKAKHIDEPIIKKNKLPLFCLKIQSCLKTLTKMGKKRIKKEQKTVCSALYYCSG